MTAFLPEVPAPPAAAPVAARLLRVVLLPATLPALLKDDGAEGADVEAVCAAMHGQLCRWTLDVAEDRRHEWREVPKALERDVLRIAMLPDLYGCVLRACAGSVVAAWHA